MVCLTLSENIMVTNEILCYYKKKKVMSVNKWSTFDECISIR